MDIEWCADAQSLYIVQARPVTTIPNSEAPPPGAHRTEPAPAAPGAAGAPDAAPLLRGFGASPGIAGGRARLLRTSVEMDRLETPRDPRDHDDHAGHGAGDGPRRGDRDRRGRDDLPRGHRLPGARGAVRGRHAYGDQDHHRGQLDHGRRQGGHGLRGARAGPEGRGAEGGGRGRRRRSLRGGPPSRTRGHRDPDLRQRGGPREGGRICPAPGLGGRSPTDRVHLHRACPRASARPPQEREEGGARHAPRERDRRGLPGLRSATRDRSGPRTSRPTSTAGCRAGPSSSHPRRTR